MGKSASTTCGTSTRLGVLKASLTGGESHEHHAGETLHLHTVICSPQDGLLWQLHSLHCMPTTAFRFRAIFLSIKLSSTCLVIAQLSCMIVNQGCAHKCVSQWREGAGGEGRRGERRGGGGGTYQGVDNNQEGSGILSVWERD